VELETKKTGREVYKRSQIQVADREEKRSNRIDQSAFATC